MNQEIKIDTQKSVFNFKRNTKKAITVLQDLFGGDLETTEENQVVSPKKKLYCLLLALFFGFLGIHRLYLSQYRYFFLHIISLSFGYLSYSILPDNGLALLILLSIVLWLIADVLAIIFSKIVDAKKRVLIYWY
jgi:TM2 domain-containing membrane protein YozV